MNPKCNLSITNHTDKIQNLSEKTNKVDRNLLTLDFKRILDKSFLIKKINY